MLQDDGRIQMQDWTRLGLFASSFLREHVGSNIIRIRNINTSKILIYRRIFHKDNSVTIIDNRLKKIS